MAQKGNIGVTTENIFPVIKKFLYSDHEIFLREMVSNAVDATQKLKTLAERGDFKGELGDLTVRVSLDTEKGTLTISDRGIGMTEEEINKYINQIAFSGVTDFLDKYKDNANAIIGHFGLGFYSSFMVSKKVDIITRSYKEGAKAVKWSCDGSPEFEIEDVEKTDRGSDIVLHIDDDCKEFLEKQKIEELLNKYCKFMAVPVAFGKKTEWKDGKQQETDEDNIINNVEPLWTKAPSTLKDEDYKSFYRTPDARRAAVLDSPQRRLSVQPHRHSLLSTHQVEHRATVQQDSALLQPSVRNRPGGRHRARVPHPTPRCNRFAGHSAERKPLVSAE